MTRFESEKPVLVYKGNGEIYGLQILKFLCALMVVQIHFDSGVRGILLPICKIAVPVFFMITGYFLPDASGRITHGGLLRVFKKVFWLELIACAVYFLFMAVSVYFKTGECANFLSLNYWLKVVFIGNVPHVHLWYLIALMQAMVFMVICLAIGVGRWIYWLIPIGLLMNLLFGSYNFLVEGDMIPNNIYLSRNVFTIALPCVLIGTLIRFYEYKLPRQRTVMIVAFMGLLGIYVETEIFKALSDNLSGDIVFMTIPFSTAVFVLFLRMKVRGRLGNRLAHWGKVYTMDMYLWHIVLATTVLYVLKALKWKTGVDYDVVIAIVVTMAGVFILRRIRLRLRKK